MLAASPDVYSVPQGMALEVFRDKYARKKEDGSFQSWEERIHEVIEGNFTLDPRPAFKVIPEKTQTHVLGRKGIFALSGRHLQHGDMDQSSKLGELFTNCSTAMFSFTKFWLLLKGSGVGRCYDNDLCYVDWDYMPHTRFVLSQSHPDYADWIESTESAKHKYDSESESVRWFTVDDSAEGWVKVVSILETAAFHKNNRDNLFVFDFSKVRKRGLPIRGQQNRPSSGPVPFIRALHEVATVRGLRWKPWKQALFIDHYLSSCVAVGGIRRSARMATKSWRDSVGDVIEFIGIKRGGHLYTANNSITVDEDFWKQASNPRPSKGRQIFEAAVAAAYWDRTGEPGFINVDKLTWSNKDMDQITVQNYLNPTVTDKLGGLHKKTYEMIDYFLERAKKKQYPFIVNPCGEIVLSAYGGYCVIGDLCLSNADNEAEVLAAGRLMARALMRANRMSFLYQAEVNRTNRIGVAITGIHEFAFKVFGLTFRELISLNTDYPQSLKDTVGVLNAQFLSQVLGLTPNTMVAKDDPQPSLFGEEQQSKVRRFWAFINNLRVEVEQSAINYAKEIGVSVPHTFTTIKPSGTVSKVLNCTEGAHLPSMPYYIRWVSFRSDDPKLADYRKRGYPVRDVSAQYKDTFIVGFPTRLAIADIMGSNVVTAGEATPEEQYRWLELLEWFWLGGPGKNNQISYTLKYDPIRVSYQDFMTMLLAYQSRVRCCSVMPQEDESAYIYLPEQKVSKEEYELVKSRIQVAETEAYDKESLACEGGVCPIDVDIDHSVMPQGQSLPEVVTSRATSVSVAAE